MIGIWFGRSKPEGYHRTILRTENKNKTLGRWKTQYFQTCVTSCYRWFTIICFPRNWPICSFQKGWEQDSGLGKKEVFYVVKSQRTGCSQKLSWKFLHLKIFFLVSKKLLTNCKQKQLFQLPNFLHSKAVPTKRKNITEVSVWDRSLCLFRISHTLLLLNRITIFRKNFFSFLCYHIFQSFRYKVSNDNW